MIHTVYRVDVVEHDTHVEVNVYTAAGDQIAGVSDGGEDKHVADLLHQAVDRLAEHHG